MEATAVVKAKAKAKSGISPLLVATCCKIKRLINEDDITIGSPYNSYIIQWVCWGAGVDSLNTH